MSVVRERKGRAMLSDRVRTRHPRIALASVALCASLVALMVAPGSGQSGGLADHIEGVVQSSAGQEAGVWVIAETSDLPTPFIKIVGSIRVSQR